MSLNSSKYDDVMKVIFSTFSLLTVSTCLQVPPAPPAHFHPSRSSIRSFLAHTHGGTHTARWDQSLETLFGERLKGHVTWGQRAMTSLAELIKRNVFFMMRELDCAVEDCAQHMYLLSVTVIWSNNPFKPWQKCHKNRVANRKNTTPMPENVVDCSPG